MKVEPLDIHIANEKVDTDDSDENTARYDGEDSDPYADALIKDREPPKRKNTDEIQELFTTSYMKAKRKFKKLRKLKESMRQENM